MSKIICCNTHVTYVMEKASSPLDLNKIFSVILESETYDRMYYILKDFTILSVIRLDGFNHFLFGKYMDSIIFHFRTTFLFPWDPISLNQ